MHPADDDPRPAGWRRTFRLPLSRRQAARELREELDFHIRMREEKLQRAGHAPHEARRLAEARFGDVHGIEAECERQDRPLMLRHRLALALDDLRQDVVVSLRGLRRAPAFTAASVATLALGIGAATAILSVAYGVLLRPLPYHEPQRLVQLSTVDSDPTSAAGFLSAPEYLDLPAAVPSLHDFAALYDAERTLTGLGYPRRLRIATATPSLFGLLGVAPVHGRPLMPQDVEPGAERAVVLGHALWREQFGGDRTVIGSRIQLDGIEHTVVGVLPRGAGVGDHDAFLPLELDRQRLRPRGAHYLRVLARLRNGAEIAGARSELAAYARRAAADHPESYPDPSFSVRATNLREAWVGGTRPTLLVLSGAVLLLLLLACANVASLLLVRAEAREREVAVRAALGAGRGRLARQQLTEMLLLAVAGAAAGLPVAWGAMSALLALNPGVVPAGTVVQLDAVVLGGAALLLLIVVLIAGLAPALQVSTLDVRSAISTGAVGGGLRGGRVRGTLVLTEIAIATVVLVGAVLAARSFWQLQQVDPGFRAEQVLTFDLSLPSQRYPEAAQVPVAYADLLERLRAHPGVRNASAVSHLPMSGRAGDWVVEVEGRPPVAGEPQLSPNFSIVAPAYLSTMGIPLLAGRDFERSDAAESQPVVLVSESLARAFWPSENPLGRRIRLGAPPPNANPWMVVAGVVGDVRGEGLAAVGRPTYYMLDAQFPAIIGGAARSMSVVVSSAEGMAPVAAAIRSVVSGFDTELAVANLRPLAEVVGGTVARPRFTTAVLLTFGGAALLLAVIGVYGVLASAVARRRRELGVRLALGSSRARLLTHILRSGLTLAAAGVALGILVALALTRTMTAVLHDVSALDPVVFAAVSFLLLAAAALASLVPALRALRVSPVEAMKTD